MFKSLFTNNNKLLLNFQSFFHFLNVFVLVCLDANIFTNCGIEFENAKIFPCRYQSVEMETKSICNPYAFGKLVSKEIVSLNWTEFTLSTTWVFSKKREQKSNI